MPRFQFSLLNDQEDDSISRPSSSEVWSLGLVAQVSANCLVPMPGWT